MYTSFSRVYDLFMDNTPYEEWSSFIQKHLNPKEKGLLLDLGCGTGKMTRLFAEAGWDMIGIDMSCEMLEIAQEHQKQEDLGILYLCQDMREFELYGTVQAIISCCDCINYITEPEELVEVFRLVNNYLDPGGEFFFDFNTVHKYRDVMGEQTFAENRPTSSFIWDNYYDEEQNINEYDLTIFIKQEKNLYEKFSETHYQRGYTLEEMKELLERGGLQFIEAYDDYTEEKATENSERICILAREKGKRL